MKFSLVIQSISIALSRHEFWAVVTQGWARDAGRVDNPPRDALAHYWPMIEARTEQLVENEVGFQV